MKTQLPLALSVVLSVFAVPPLVAADKDKEKEPPKVDQARVDAAIAKGAEYLKARVNEGLPPLANESNLHTGQTYNEIVLYTLLHAGVPKNDPLILKLVQDTRATPLAHTYGTAIRGQAFEKFDPVKMTADLMQVAQFLVDNQSKEGWWGYSKAVPLDPLPKLDLEGPKVTVTAPGNVSAHPLAAAAGRATQALKKRATLTRRGWGDPHDNSNTQYAMLGIASCLAAGIWPPEDTFTLVEKWLTDQQDDDGGWNYTRRGEASYGSMTAGAISTLAICLNHYGQNPLKDIRIQKGIAWMAKNMTFDSNPNKGGWHYYWIYSVERAGSMTGTRWFEDRPWYYEGATWLLEKQSGDGSWGKANNGDKVTDTCWAILFLKQATGDLRKKITETPDAHGKK